MIYILFYLSFIIFYYLFIFLLLFVNFDFIDIIRQIIAQLQNVFQNNCQ